ncbi:MAG: GNAT family N-acetyltransferase, partial [Balneolaceae bacterium]|nr:GNAT family N-acetyltransferase [Balneolaceae bacterium]
MKFVYKESLNKEQKSRILKLWNQEYPQKLFLSDQTALEEYLQGLNDKHHILLCDDQDVVKGWLLYFIRDGERCFAMILDASIQGQGWGSKLLDEAKKSNYELNGWVIDHNTELKANGETYHSPTIFYEKNGFRVLRKNITIKKDIKGIK